VRGVFNPDSRAIKEGGVEFDLNLPFDSDFVRSTRLGVGYRYLRRLPLFAESEIGNANNRGIGDGSLSQIDLTARIELTARIRLTYSTIYSFTNDQPLRNQGLVEYVSKCQCWGFGARIDYERNQGFGGGFEIRFLGLGGEQRDLFSGGLGSGLNF
jgi:lipopolysaccharide assembly outer membrane protein LptD (OstA)